MALRRANTQLKTLEGGRVVHVDSPDQFAKTVSEFLRELRN